MLDVKNPEIRVEDLMQRIQEKVRLRRERAPASPSAPPPTQSSIHLNQLVSQARDTAQVGLAVPAMSRTHGLKRALATPIAKLFLRVAQLVTRDQRAFNQTVVAALQAILEGLQRMADRQAEDASRAASLVKDAEAKFTPVTQRIDQLNGRLDALAAQTLKLEQLRTTIALQERRLTLLLEEARRRLPAPMDAQQLETFARELPRVADAGYLAFEDAFRGSREEIKSRVSIYVPKFRDAGAGVEAAAILDLGCGRGELLEVLRENGLKASGVDSNHAAVEQCRARNLDVVAGDLFETLRKTPDATLGGVAALHVVEHLPYPIVLELLDEIVRVLRPGGIAILETPNPNNVLVGASTFYVDPTHRNPVHPQTLQYLFEARGFVRVEALMLHPYPEGMRIREDTAVARMFNEYFYGPQDYAVVGRRA